MSKQLDRIVAGPADAVRARGRAAQGGRASGGQLQDDFLVSEERAEKLSGPSASIRATRSCRRSTASQHVKQPATR
ncbi:MAG: hypothetical protein GY856_34895 [bacterium]|nr:hypothetical protein [bacterium]